MDKATSAQSANAKHKWYRFKAERAYACQWCGYHLHATVGIPFERTRTPLALRLYAIYVFTTSGHGVPAKDLQRLLGVTYKCAGRMGHKIHEHMASADCENLLYGVIEADESYVDGDKPGERGRGAEGKTVVFDRTNGGSHQSSGVISAATGLPDIEFR